jgi:hypothetical protein
MVKLLHCPFCQRDNADEKELSDFGGMCKHCWQAMAQIKKWSPETRTAMLERAARESRLEQGALKI